MMLLALLIGFAHADVTLEIQARLARPIEPGPFTHELQTRDLDLPDLPGRLYGAVAWQTIDEPIAKIRAFFAAPGAIFQMLAAVRTQRDLVKVAESVNALELKLAIKVPVVPDYHTQDRVTLDGDRLSWHQSAPDGMLEYNQGYLQILADGESACRVLVVGVHLIKDDHRVPWIGRGTATRFAREHYAGYVEALRSVLR